MNLEKRINNLEEDIAKRYIDPKVDAELTEWFKVTPEYIPFAQPESNDSVVMPDHLEKAFAHRMNNLFSERNLIPTGNNLLKIYKDLF